MYGIIDIGSNTIRLSMYKSDGVKFTPMFNKKFMAGLAGYVDEDGYLSEQGIDKAVSSLSQFKQIIENVEPKEVFAVATASLRNITNSEEATAEIEKRTGIKIDVISGNDEAIYDFVGATSFLDLKDGILIDIGGGSTELVFYKNSEIVNTFSMPIGSLNMYKNHVKDIIPNAKEFAKIEKNVKEELKKLGDAAKGSGYTLTCGVGGTVRAVRAIRDEISPEFAKNSITMFEIDVLLSAFKSNRSFATQKIIKCIPDRIHTLLPGMIILNTVAKKYKCESIMISEYGVREGYLYTKLLELGGN